MLASLALSSWMISSYTSYKHSFNSTIRRDNNILGVGDYNLNHFEQTSSSSFKDALFSELTLPPFCSSRCCWDNSVYLCINWAISSAFLAWYALSSEVREFCFSSSNFRGAVLMVNWLTLSLGSDSELFELSSCWIFWVKLSFSRVMITCNF